MRWKKMIFFIRLSLDCERVGRHTGRRGKVGRYVGDEDR
jgi:hypothetical protein